MRSAGTTAALAEFVAAAGSSPLPDDVAAAARRMLLDSTGCAIAGAADDAFVPLLAYARSAFGPGPIPAPGGGELEPAPAAFLMGTAGHLLDYDDVHVVMGGHPSVCLMPVAYAVGHLIAASGERLLRAFAVGAEVAIRIGAAVNPSHYSIGWHPTSVIGTMGAAACAASLLDLDAARTRQALGLAASFASGTKANFGTLAKPLHAGSAARSGLDAALLVRAGATANDHILDAQYGGYAELFAREVDRARALDRLGSRYLLVDPPVAYKLLPCCGSTQAAAWGGIYLYQEDRIAPERIREIRVRADPQRLPHTDRPDVSTGLEAKFSTQYCVATALLKGSLTFSDFTDEASREVCRQQLMTRVRLIPDDAAATWSDAVSSATGSRGAIVEVDVADGETRTKFVPSPRGYPAAPATDGELRAKFLDCASRAFTVGEADDLADRISGIASSSDVRAVTARLWKARERR